MSKLRIGLLVLTALCFALPAFAVDGVVLINQNTIVDGLPGCPGPNPGNFPIVICNSGSYRLSGNLTIPDADSNGINIAADNVTLDLNGFAVSGPVTCTRQTYPLQCSGSGAGVGISTFNRKSITVRNGTVRGMGKVGIDLTRADGALVEDVHVADIGPGNCPPPIDPRGCGVGIQMTDQAIGVVTHCIVETSAGDGIVGIGAFGLGPNVIVNASVVSFNGGDGIDGVGGVFHSAVNFNGQSGITFSSNVVESTIANNVGRGLSFVEGFRGNVIRNNGSTLMGGFSLGGNLCASVIC